jgi:hypothetical protein
MRLIMPDEQGSRPRHVGPFGEALALPFIIFGKGMELGQVDCHHPHIGYDRRGGVGHDILGRG